MTNIIIALLIAEVVNWLPLPLVTRCIIMVVIGCLFGALVSLLENIKSSRKKKSDLVEGGADDCTN